LKYPNAQKSWLTSGIKVSCANKRRLYLLAAARSSSDPKVKAHFKKYCRILSKVIEAAKKLHYNTLIVNSNNKTKTTWNIVKTITNNTGHSDTITNMKINDRLSCNPIDIIDAFNTYFSSISEKTLNDNPSGYPSVNNREFLVYLQQKFQH
jgi:hypothetical protein